MNRIWITSRKWDTERPICFPFGWLRPRAIYRSAFWPDIKVWAMGTTAGPISTIRDATMWCSFAEMEVMWSCRPTIITRCWRNGYASLASGICRQSHRTIRRAVRTRTSNRIGMEKKKRNGKRPSGKQYTNARHRRKDTPHISITEQKLLDFAKLFFTD